MSEPTWRMEEDSVDQLCELMDHTKIWCSLDNRRHIHQQFNLTKSILNNTNEFSLHKIINHVRAIEMRYRMYLSVGLFKEDYLGVLVTNFVNVVEDSWLSRLATSYYIDQQLMEFIRRLDQKEVT